MAYRNTIVSKNFRSIVLATFPELAPRSNDPIAKKRRQWFCFFDLLCFPTSFDEGSKEWPLPVISRKQILKALGLPESTPSKKFKARTFLDEIIDNNVLRNFRYVDHVVDSAFASGRARIALPNFPKAFNAALDQETANFHSVPPANRVHLVTGEPWRKTTPGKLKAADLANATAFPSDIPEAQQIIDYLNGLPSNVFATKVNANIKGAVAIASNFRGRQRTEQLTRLQRILAQPQPFYGPSDRQNTARIFALNTAIQNLKNEVKYSLIDSWVTFDLRSSQLAIVSKDWGLDELRTWLLDFNHNIWNELCALFPTIPTADAKPILKDAVYSACYGGAKKTIRRHLVVGLSLPSNDVTPFFRHRFIKKVFVHRKAVMDEIVEKGGAVDCFGKWHPYTTTVATVRGKITRKSNVRSVMAALSQAQEMQLLLPAIELAKERAQWFTIVLWEHDGFSVRFTKKDRIESESQRIIDVVNDECSKRGYPTRLERKPPPPSSKPTK